MTTEQSGKINSIFQYINTVILTVVGIFAVMIFTTINKVRAEQEALKLIQADYGKELLRLKTVQDRNVTDISKLDARVVILEINYIDRLKEWVDQNYQRKLQK